ncbi:MAG: two-component regulator propeller domain-containing protein [Vicinamibacterales bacterium]|nr:two-component regulator propeller domain-containing protein [Vicinamibacterales bacterium]
MALAPAPAAALPGDKALTQYMHHVWQTRDGLPQNTITAVVQTPDGYLWLGTREGLVRFDGARFTVFETRTTPALGHNFVRSLMADRAGRLWIGTSGGGLVRMEHGTFTRFAAADGLPSEMVSALFEDRHGTLWVGTDGGGLARFDGRTFATEPARDALGLSVRAITEDEDGLWVGTDDGLAHLAFEGPLRSFGLAEGLTRLSVRSLLRDRQGVLWVGTDLGLHRYAGGRFTVFTTRDGLSHNVIAALHEDRDGHLWIGTDGGGLNRWRDGAFSAFTSRHGLSNDSVFALLEDREGSLWIGTNLGGLNRLMNGRMTPLTTREGLANDHLRAIYEDRAGTLWIGTEGGGVNRIRDGQITAITTREGLSNDIVFAIIEDREGSLWFGTDNGLTRLRNGRIEVFHAGRGGLSNDSVLALHEGRDGSLWIGTYAGGLNRYKDGRFTAFTTKEGLTNDTVNVIHEDRAGVLWIGTRGGGLNRLEDGRLTALTTRDGLTDDLVFALHEDADGSLWIGTYGGGLNRLKDGRLTAVTERQGLFDDVVHRVIEDAEGYVWMSSNRGISRVLTRELHQAADGTLSHVSPIVYGTVDGMRNAECNGGASAGTRTRDGRIWFPTIEGAVVIDPARITANTVPPPLAIEDVLVDGVAVPSDGTLRLPTTAQSLEVHFTALSLVAPDAVRFRYRLEGFETEWVQAQNRRTAYYSRLPPGQYRFRVIAANNDGVWNDEGATLDFAVAPRVHETWWFRGGVVLVFLLAGPVFYRVRVRHLTRQKAALERLVAERTTELEAANARLAQLAREDGLTGLLNRRAFDESLEQECRRAARQRTPVALMLLDIDCFKAYNDLHGHQAGDACLRAVCGEIASGHRRAGEIVGRYGGEELAVVVPGVTEAEAAAMAETLRQRVEALAVPHADSTAGTVVTVSVGLVCAVPGSNASAEALVAAADRALYQAKQDGRNRVAIAGALPEAGASAAPLA